MALERLDWDVQSSRHSTSAEQVRQLQVGAVTVVPAGCDNYSIIWHGFGVLERENWGSGALVLLRHHLLKLIIRIALVIPGKRFVIGIGLDRVVLHPIAPSFENFVAYMRSGLDDANRDSSLLGNHVVVHIQVFDHVWLVGTIPLPVFFPV